MSVRMCAGSLGPAVDLRDRANTPASLRGQPLLDRGIGAAHLGVDIDVATAAASPAGVSRPRTGPVSVKSLDTSTPE